ncbi:DNA-protecting protein DprA [Affinibrenneria salicis]|uniref:DNA-protecting protein DprA n=1 Tax=Affinibrenneria salicis TaxID=2590031 RepID=A0A5J5FQ59_9GAMM|nr:DNA-protecting protein DprA [Affinibrenneria salicis]KAA8994870.1 DNA-protecting protein DprA [Affinibrenneria salicis]
MEPAEIWLRLMSVRHLRREQAAQAAKKLIESGGCRREALFACGLDDEKIRQFFHQDSGAIVETLRWLEAPDNHMLTWHDAAWPALLANIAAPPLVLFVCGSVSALSLPQLAIVGSRNNSLYGEQWGRFFAQELALSELAITSGLALGIDAVAHRAALQAGGKTLAVLGNGLATVYPRRHRALAAQIIAQGGAIVSEFPLAMAPLPANFPRRNRIISGLSLGVLIVEASLRSGSLVTARYALEQNREVFALPGPLGNAMTQGTHWLIQQGAYLVTQPKDILEQLGNGLEWLKSAPADTIYASIDEVELPFADVLANVGDEVTPVDVVAERAGQPVPDVVRKLLDLELAGWIAAVPGGYVRLRRAGHVRRTHVLV